MVCQFAIAKINELKAHGLEPTPEDIIRLNALGLKVEALKKKRPHDSLEFLPRVAAISSSVSFRQPTIGHDIWLDKVERICSHDFQTSLAVKAFALSRPASLLPDPDDPKSIQTAVMEYCESMKDFTRDQIYAAIEYVVYGADERIGELAAHAQKDEDEDDDGIDGWDEQDWKHCVSVGVLREGQAVLFGVTRAEIEDMPRTMLEDLIHRAYYVNRIPMDFDASEAEGNFYVTLDEIKVRLEREKNHGDE